MRPTWANHSGHHLSLRPAGRGRPHRLRGHNRQLCSRDGDGMTIKIDAGVTPVCHFVKGETIFGTEHLYGGGDARFATPKLDLDSLVWPRNEAGPAFEVP